MAPCTFTTSSELLKASRQIPVPDEFAETVVELYKDEKRLEDLAEKTQVYIREHFSIDAAWDVIKEDFE